MAPPGSGCWLVPGLLWLRLSAAQPALLTQRPAATLGAGVGDWPANATPPFAQSWRTNDSTLLYWRNGSGFVSDETLDRYGMFIWGELSQAIGVSQSGGSTDCLRFRHLVSTDCL